MVFCRGVGQGFVRVDCVPRPTSSPPTHCHDSAVVSESASTKHSLQGMQTSSLCLHTLRTDERERGCYACEESLERHFENNDYVCSFLHNTPTPERYTGESRAKTTVFASRRGKSDQGQGRENTGLLLQILPVAFICF